MKTKGKTLLACKICNHETVDLISHIEEAHTDITLEDYINKYNIKNENELLISEEETTPKKKEKSLMESSTAVATTGKTVNISDIDVPLSLASVAGKGGRIPKKIDHYHFAPHAKDIIQDIIENKKVMLIGHTGCVAGDTIINLNRGGKGFAIKIEDAYKLFIGEARNGKKWDTRLQTKIRSHIEKEERIGLNNAVRFVQSGIKKTMTLTLEDGSSLRATADHEILTTRGYIALGDIKPNDEVICDRTVEVESKEKTRYKLIMGLKFHPYSDKIKGAAYNGGEYNRVPEHRLVAEATLSNVTLEDFIDRCRKGYDLDSLEFLDPSIFVVHHKDENTLNNAPENLDVMTHEDHKRHHGIKNQMNFGRGTPTPIAVSSVNVFGEEMTYDIVCEDPNRNFVANGMIIHNCGKTSVIDQIASRIGQTVVRSNLNGGTTVGDFVGLWTVKSGETVWVDGNLPTAMKHGYWLLLDEIDFCEASVLHALNSVLESEGTLELKEKGGELVKPHPNFRLFATANAAGKMAEFRHLYQGANIMNEAFLDRWRCYVIDYMKPDEEVKVIQGELPRYAKSASAAQVIVKVVNMVREAFVKEEISCTFSTRRAIDWADLMLRYKDPMKAAEVAVFSKIPRADAEVIKGIIQRVMASKGKS